MQEWPRSKPRRTSEYDESLRLALASRSCPEFKLAMDALRPCEPPMRLSQSEDGVMPEAVERRRVGDVDARLEAAAAAAAEGTADGRAMPTLSCVSVGLRRTAKAMTDGTRSSRCG